jgi:hypothetical protein
VRQPNLDPIVQRVEPDQATNVGVLDRLRPGDPPQRRQLNRFTDRKRVDDGAD